jgi:uncharacterized protein YbgA (DUF1722 family)/uncharacterized protein YbbK (DUF523 family)
MVGASMTEKMLIGVSGCVIGHKVRFDGGHKKNHFITETLRPFAEFIPICPEVESGMPVPRPTIRLAEKFGEPILVETKNAANDYTAQMIDFSTRKVLALQSRQLCGYIVASKSPTCGMQNVKIYHSGGVKKSGVGLYTRELMTAMPWLPVEEDGRLNDPVLRENFILRVFCLHDLYQSVGPNPTKQSIVAFHSRYKFTLMAHDPVAYRELGRMIAHLKGENMQSFFANYRFGLMNALSNRASRKNCSNVLMHFQGYFKRFLNPVQKSELTRIIHEYRLGLLPLLVPVTMIKHYLASYPNVYIAQQHYLNPYPQALKLRYGL